MFGNRDGQTDIFRFGNVKPYQGFRKFPSDNAAWRWGASELYTLMPFWWFFGSGEGEKVGGERGEGETREGEGMGREDVIGVEGGD